MSPRSKSRTPLAVKPKRATFEARMAPFIAGLPADAGTLIDLYDAYRAANDALTGILNRPRVAEEGAAADMIDEEIERATDHACAVAEKLEQLSCVDVQWRDTYVQTMMSHAVFCGANIDGMLSSLTAARSVPVKRADKGA